MLSILADFNLWYNDQMNKITRMISVLLAFWGLILPAEANQLNLVHTGDINGMASAYRYQMDLPYQLMADFSHQHQLSQERGQAPETAEIHDFAIQQTAIYFYSEQHYLWGPQFGVRELQAFLQAPPTPLSRETVYLLQSNNALIMAPPKGTQLIQEVAQFAASQNKYQSKLQLQEAELLTYPQNIHILRLPRTAAYTTNALDWEMILGFQMQVNQNSGSPHELQIIGKPQGEGSRRMTLLNSLRTPKTLLVDSGNMLEGLSSVITNSLSLQRNNSLNMARDLDYFAINVGKGELRGGLANLLREQESHDLPLISASLKQNGQYVFPAYKTVSMGKQTAALIGITDDAPLKRLQALGELDPSLEILGPERALEEVIHEIQSQNLADVIVVLASLDPEQLRFLANQGRNIHLILGNTDTPLQHLKESMEMDLVADPQPFLAYANRYSINLIQVKSEKQNLTVSNEMIPIYFDLHPNKNHLSKIQAIRQKAYADALDPLIPNLGPAIQQDPELLDIFVNSRTARKAAQKLGGLKPLEREQLLMRYPPFMTAEMLVNLEMNALMESFNAEVVVFKSSESMEINVPGAIPRLLVYEQLKMGDTLEMYYLSGSQIKQLLNLPQDQLLFGGISSDGSKVWGRPLGDQHSVYRALIPSGVSSLPGIRDILAQARSSKQIHNPFAPQKTGEPIYLRNTIISFLDALREKPDQLTQWVRLMKPIWNQKQLLFSMNLDNFQLNLSGYNALNNASYAEVRETRVISPSSFTFGGKSGFGFGWDNQYFGFKNSAHAKYEGLSVLQELADSSTQKRFTENQDDLYFSSELEMRLFEFPLFETKIVLVPFLESIYDTEFTPTLNTDTNLYNPLQSELRGVLGLSIPPGPKLKKFKSGLALRRDFNVPDNLELGFDFKFVHDQPINTALKWSNDLDLRYFFPSPNDNASSLGLIAQWISSLNVSLTENLVLRFFADAYVFQGKRPETAQFGASVILGVGLGYDRIWKPFYEPLF